METVSTARRLLVSNSIHFHFFGVFSMKTDIEIAQETKLIPINELAHSAGLADSEFEPYGRDKAKVTLDPSRQEKGRLILVTATSGMPAGSGKTTTSIALAQGLKRLGKNAALALRGPGLRHEGRRRRRRLQSGAADGSDQPALHG